MWWLSTHMEQGNCTILSLFALKLPELCCNFDSVNQIMKTSDAYSMWIILKFNHIYWSRFPSTVWIRFVKGQTVFPRGIDLPASGDSTTTAIWRRLKPFAKRITNSQYMRIKDVACVLVWGWSCWVCEIICELLEAMWYTLGLARTTNYLVGIYLRLNLGLITWDLSIWRTDTTQNVSGLTIVIGPVTHIVCQKVNQNLKKGLNSVSFTTESHVII